MNNSVLVKSWKAQENNGALNLQQQKKRINSLVLEPNHYASKFFSKYLIAIAMKNAQVLMNNSVYLGLAILQISEIVMYEF